MDLERDRRRKPSPEDSSFRFSGTTLTDILYDEEVVLIPDFCEKIGVCAFLDNLYVEKVVIPGSVTRIDDAAFLGCMYLKTLQLSEGLEEIGDAAFLMTALSSLLLPGTLRRIGEEAFQGCPLEEVVLPEGLLEVGACAFSECSQLKAITIPDSLETLSGDAFDLCPQLRHVRVSRLWESTHPDLCRKLCQQIRTNFLQKTERFFRSRRIIPTSDQTEALHALESISGLTELETAINHIAAKLRQQSGSPQKTKILRNAIRCRLCGEEIESGYRHNFVLCRCGACGVDGGRDYLRRIGNRNDYTELSEEIALDTGEDCL